MEDLQAGFLPQWGPAARAGISDFLKGWVEAGRLAPQWGPAARAGISPTIASSGRHSSCLNGVRPRGPESVTFTFRGCAVYEPQWGPAARAGISNYGTTRNAQTHSLNGVRPRGPESVVCGAWLSDRAPP